MNEIVLHEEAEIAPTTLFGTSDPDAALAHASRHAKTFERLVREQGLIVSIGRSEHVKVEAWTALGAMLGIHGVVTWTRPVMDGEQQVGWEARCEARNLAGVVVGAAEAVCTRSESLWRGRDDYALKSMAQTRALSKSLRGPLGFILVLAGFNPTPAEEMPPVIEGNHSAGAPAAGADGPPSSPVSRAAPDGGSEPAAPAHPPVDLSDPDIPFGDAPPDPPKPTKAQLKKLDVMVKSKLVDHPAFSLERVYTTVGEIRGWKRVEVEAVVYGRDTHGVLHWSPLRDSLSKHEAHVLIDKLEALEATV